MFKFSKKFLSLIMAILILGMTAIGVNAEELITGIDDLLIDIGIIDPSPEEELMPMAASGCSFQMFRSNEKANEAIQNCVDSNDVNPGFGGAEEFKAEFGFRSNANLGYDKTTGEIYIFPNGGEPYATGYYIQ